MGYCGCEWSTVVVESAVSAAKFFGDGTLMGARKYKAFLSQFLAA